MTPRSRSELTSWESGSRCETPPRKRSVKSIDGDVELQEPRGHYPRGQRAFLPRRTRPGFDARELAPTRGASTTSGCAAAGRAKSGRCWKSSARGRIGGGLRSRKRSTTIRAGALCDDDRLSAHLGRRPGSPFTRRPNSPPLISSRNQKLACAPQRRLFTRLFRGYDARRPHEDDGNHGLLRGLASRISLSLWMLNGVVPTAIRRRMTLSIATPFSVANGSHPARLSSADSRPASHSPASHLTVSLYYHSLSIEWQLPFPSRRNASATRREQMHSKNDPGVRCTFHPSARRTDCRSSHRFPRMTR